MTAVAVMVAVVMAAMCTGCASYQDAPIDHGKVRSTAMTTADLAQTDINRMATLGMRANLEGLYRLADKLYKRNPREWRKGGAATQAQAMTQLRAAIEERRSLPALRNLRDVKALSLSLDPAFSGDRVAAFVYSLSDTIVAAHGGTTVFYLSDGLDAQRIYNAARNVEIAAWLLSSRHDMTGKPLLLANELTDVRNVSFEREFGKIIGRLDLLAEMLDEKYRRAGIGYVQNMLGAQFLQFLPVR
ncbi:lipoprotein [Pandoraea soli]|uniref:Lipoprotein n=2 Tax=Pandoraea soli TaxID=2508293 RepID=A0ABY6W406_9BURK|nr:lipoprotein [Pandoraea soli]